MTPDDADSKGHEIWTAEVEQRARDVVEGNIPSGTQAVARRAERFQLIRRFFSLRRS
jgi:hypothetical protein